ncbi:hypothetical protein DEU56DRAFT_788754 [Suillus clintonianus]|uniref:uncharacterized protein n=1 Tax=Suillus clintonianus TaxID=1904413 RepID=UPI001B87CFC6|nr:uncharacterized protein DEU56DRAFT_788754 [Suillus clintonianus]KAG2145924.1 hypothetical protein DEU56DRAFT_788754 [Suillus clintonianus]
MEHCFNYCLNSARGLVKHIHCSLHVDCKNIVIDICDIFVYSRQLVFLFLFSNEAKQGNFNSKEKSWLVVWGAGLMLEVSAGILCHVPFLPSLPLQYGHVRKLFFIERGLCQVTLSCSISDYVYSTSFIHPIYPL